MNKRFISRPLLNLFTWTLFCLVALNVFTSQSLAEGIDGEVIEVLEKVILAQRQYIIIGEAQETIFFPPRSIPTQPTSHFSQPARANLQLIKENFDIILEEGGNIIQREVWVLKLIAKNNISPNWHFTIDKETGLRLAYEQRTQDGQLVSEGYFESISDLHLRFDPNLEDPLSQTSRNPSPAQLTAVRRLLGNSSLPIGFKPVRLERSRIGNRPALRLTAWDGINILALLVYPNASAVVRPFTPKEVIAQAPYVRSLKMRFVTLTVLAPLPERVLEDWLETLSRGRLGLISRRQLDRFFRE